MRLLLLTAPAIVACCAGQLAPLAPAAVVVGLSFGGSAFVCDRLLAGALHETIGRSEAVADCLCGLVVGNAVVVHAVAELVIGACLCGNGHDDDGEG